jgi:hypothetical protein
MTHEDFQACLLFAQKLLEDTVFMPLEVESAYPAWTARYNVCDSTKSWKKCVGCVPP